MTHSVRLLPHRRAVLGGALALFGARPWRAFAAEPAGARIVAIGGAVTEIVYALGLAQRLVGVDTTSLYPPEALKDKPNVGYMRALSAEGILSLKPDLVVAMAGSGPPAILKLVEEAGVRLVTIPDDPTPEGAIEKIRMIGRLLGAEAPAEGLAADVERRFAAVAAARKAVTTPVRALFVLTLQGGRPLVAGTKTAADGMIALAGATNVGAGFEAYKAMTDEAIIAAAPDVVVMMANGGARTAPETVFALPALAATPASANRRLVSADGLWLLGFGPRTPEAAGFLFRAFYPDLPAPAGLDLPGPPAAGKP
jgi:iron complex transport system substrate-binding protein